MKMCDEYYSLFVDLVNNKHRDLKKNTQMNIASYLFLLKQKYQKVFRDNLYFNFKAKMIFLNQ